jgi:uncharacterized protein (DUF2236 family)
MRNRGGMFLGSSKLIVGDRFFSPTSMIWRVDREMALLAAGGRALLMQLAHPKVAAGVAAYSEFQHDPLSRLQRTMSTMWSIVFDEAEQARRALDRLRRVHANVKGVIGTGEPVPAGTQYDAQQAELLLWVHATLVDSALLAYDCFVERMSLQEKRRYYEDSKKLAGLFDIPHEAVPGSLADFESYMERMVSGNDIAVGPSAKRLAQEILYPSPWLLRPLAPLFRLVTAGLLPARLRDAYGLSWSSPREKTFQVFSGVVRRLLPLVPPPLRIVANARRAEKQLQ